MRVIFKSILSIVWWILNECKLHFMSWFYEIKLDLNTLRNILSLTKLKKKSYFKIQFFFTKKYV